MSDPAPTAQKTRRSQRGREPDTSATQATETDGQTERAAQTKRTKGDKRSGGAHTRIETRPTARRRRGNTNEADPSSGSSFPSEPSAAGAESYVVDSRAGFFFSCSPVSSLLLSSARRGDTMDRVRATGHTQGVLQERRLRLEEAESNRGSELQRHRELRGQPRQQAERGDETRGRQRLVTRAVETHEWSAKRRTKLGRWNSRDTMRAAEDQVIRSHEVGQAGGGGSFVVGLGGATRWRRSLRLRYRFSPASRVAMRACGSCDRLGHDSTRTDAWIRHATKARGTDPHETERTERAE